MMKILPCVVVILFLLTFLFCGCMGWTMTIFVEKTDFEPDKFVNISEVKMENFSSLKKAIQSEKSYIGIPQEEYRELISLLDTDNTNYICYNNEYYSVGFATD